MPRVPSDDELEKEGIEIFREGDSWIAISTEFPSVSGAHDTKCGALMHLASALALNLRHIEATHREDRERIGWLASQGFLDGFEGLKKTFNDYVLEETLKNKRFESNKTDKLNAFRKMLDDARALVVGEEK